MIPFYEIKRQPISIFFSGHMEFPFHLHEEVELLHVRRGRLTVQLHDGAHSLSEGGLFIAFPNVIHAYQPVPAAGSEVLTVIAGLQLCGPHRHFLRSCRPVCPVADVRTLHRDVAYCLEGLAAVRDPANETAVCGSYLQLLLSRWLPAMEVTDERDAGNPDLAARVITFISCHFREPLTLAEVARQVGVNRCYLSRFFNHKLSTGFPEYLHTLRVNLAEELLGNTDWTIGEISGYCGYDNQRTFNRVYRQKHNMSPREWRRIHSERLIPDEGGTP